jgi:anti-sigma-K factor RskA
MTARQSRGRASGVPAEAELREDIERTRRQLGDAAEALAAKADVKARARQKASQVREQAIARASQARDQAASGWRSNPAAVGAAGAAVVFACIAIALWRRR